MRLVTGRTVDDPLVMQGSVKWRDLDAAAFIGVTAEAGFDLLISRGGATLVSKNGEWRIALAAVCPGHVNAACAMAGFTLTPIHVDPELMQQMKNITN